MLLVTIVFSNETSSRRKVDEVVVLPFFLRDEERRGALGLPFGGKEDEVFVVLVLWSEKVNAIGATVAVDEDVAAAGAAAGSGGVIGDA